MHVRVPWRSAWSNENRKEAVICSESRNPFDVSSWLMHAGFTWINNGVCSSSPLGAFVDAGFHRRATKLLCPFCPTGELGVGLISSVRLTFSFLKSCSISNLCIDDVHASWNPSDKWASGWGGSSCGRFYTPTNRTSSERFLLNNTERISMFSSRRNPSLTVEAHIFQHPSSRSYSPRYYGGLALTLVSGRSLS